MVDKSGPDNPETNPAADANPAAGAPLDCEQWEALLVDKMDGALAPEREAAFAEHSRICPGCEGLLEEAKKGQEWLKLLEEHAPAAPVDLLSRILAKTQGAGRERDYAIGTSGLGAAGLAAHGGLGGLGGGRWGLPASGLLAARGAHKARMVMTGAMAFFSVALTLSVAGVRVHAAELRPQVVQANVSRSFYGTKKQVVSFYENLRLVYEVESKMHELRGDEKPSQQEGLPDRRQAAPAQSKPTPPAQTEPKSQPTPKAHASSSGRVGDAPAEHKGDSKGSEQGGQVLHGWTLLVDYVPGAGRLLDLGSSLERQRSGQQGFRSSGGTSGASSGATSGATQASQPRAVRHRSKEQTSAVSSTLLHGAMSKERNRT